MGVLAAQIVHAAGESSPGNLSPHTHAVVLAAKNENHLLKLEAKLLTAGIKHYSIREPDPPWNNALMAIGFSPCPQGTFKKLFNGYQLLKEEITEDKNA